MHAIGCFGTKPTTTKCPCYLNDLLHTCSEIPFSLNILLYNIKDLTTIIFFSSFCGGPKISVRSGET